MLLSECVGLASKQASYFSLLLREYHQLHNFIQTNIDILATNYILISHPHLYCFKGRYYS